MPFNFPRIEDLSAVKPRAGTGDSVNLSFVAPPLAKGKTRSLFLHPNSYYEVELGHGYWLNPLAIYRHRMGTDSAPRYFLRSLRRN